MGFVWEDSLARLNSYERDEDFIFSPAKRQAHELMEWVVAV